MDVTAIPPQLAAIAEEHLRLDARVARLMVAVTEAQWGQRRDPAAWSVAENVAHLNLTSAAMVPRLREAWERARALGAPAGPYRPRLLGRVLAAMMGPVPTVLGFRLGRVRTAAAFVPGGALPRETVMAEFARWQLEERALLREAAGLAIDRVTIESPFVPGTHYDGYSALRILVRHAFRHVDQAERVWGTA